MPICVGGSPVRIAYGSGHILLGEIRGKPDVQAILLLGGRVSKVVADDAIDIVWGAVHPVHGQLDNRTIARS